MTMKPKTKKPIPTFGTIAWQRFAMGAVKAATEDAKRRRRWKPDMQIIHKGHRLRYSVSIFGRVLVDIGGRQAAGWYGDLP